MSGRVKELVKVYQNAEVLRLKRGFDKVDDDGDGLISKVEFITHFRSFFPGNRRCPKAVRIERWQHVDHDQDGHASFFDLLSYMADKFPNLLLPEAMQNDIARAVARNDVARLPEDLRAWAASALAVGEMTSEALLRQSAKALVQRIGKEESWASEPRVDSNHSHDTVLAVLLAKISGGELFGPEAALSHGLDVQLKALLRAACDADGRDDIDGCTTLPLLHVERMAAAGLRFESSEQLLRGLRLLLVKSDPVQWTGMPEKFAEYVTKNASYCPAPLVSAVKARGKEKRLELSQLLDCIADSGLLPDMRLGGLGIAVLEQELARVLNDERVSKREGDPGPKAHIAALHEIGVQFDRPQDIAHTLELLYFDTSADELAVHSLPAAAAQYVMTHSYSASSRQGMVAMMVGEELQPGAHEAIAQLVQEVRELKLLPGNESASGLAVELVQFFDELTQDGGDEPSVSVMEVSAELRRLAQARRESLENARGLVDALRVAGCSKGLAQLVRVGGEAELGGGFITLKVGPRATVLQLKTLALGKFKSKGWSLSFKLDDFQLVKNKSRPLPDTAIVLDIFGKPNRAKDNAPKPPKTVHLLRVTGVQRAVVSRLKRSAAIDVLLICTDKWVSEVLLQQVERRIRAGSTELKVNWHAVVFGEEHLQPSLLRSALCVCLAFDGMSEESLGAVRRMSKDIGRSHGKPLLGLGVDTSYPMTGTQLIDAFERDERARELCGLRLGVPYVRVSFPRALRVEAQGMELNGPAQHINPSRASVNKKRSAMTTLDPTGQPQRRAAPCRPVYGFVAQAFAMTHTHVTLGRALVSNSEIGTYDFQPNDILELLEGNDGTGWGKGSFLGGHTLRLPPGSCEPLTRHVNPGFVHIQQVTVEGVLKKGSRRKPSWGGWGSERGSMTDLPPAADGQPSFFLLGVRAALGEWDVTRRYSSIEAFRAKLCEKFPQIAPDFTPLPLKRKKWALLRKGEAVIQERRQAVDAFFHTLCLKHSAVLHARVAQRFFQVSAQLRNLGRGDTNVPQPGPPSRKGTMDDSVPTPAQEAADPDVGTPMTPKAVSDIAANEEDGSKDWVEGLNQQFAAEMARRLSDTPVPGPPAPPPEEEHGHDGAKGEQKEEDQPRRRRRQRKRGHRSRRESNKAASDSEGSGTQSESSSESSSSGESESLGVRNVSDFVGGCMRKPRRVSDPPKSVTFAEGHTTIVVSRRSSTYWQSDIESDGSDGSPALHGAWTEPTQMKEPEEEEVPNHPFADANYGTDTSCRSSSDSDRGSRTYRSELPTVAEVKEPLSLVEEFAAFEAKLDRELELHGVDLRIFDGSAPAQHKGGKEESTALAPPQADEEDLDEVVSALPPARDTPAWENLPIASKVIHVLEEVDSGDSLSDVASSADNSNSDSDSDHVSESDDASDSDGDSSSSRHLAGGGHAAVEQLAKLPAVEPHQHPFASATYEGTSSGEDTEELEEFDDSETDDSEEGERIA